MNSHRHPDDFEKDLKQAFAGIRASKEECPDAETLSQFAGGELGKEAADYVRLHVQKCGVCDHVIDRLRQFDVAAQVGEPVNRPRKLLGFLLHPAFSYSLVALLAVTLFLVRRPRQVATEPPARQARATAQVAARAAQLIAEEMTLQELRRARQLTQVRMAKALGIGQDGISKLEKRSDLLLSTLRKTVEAMGGSLSLVAEFPDRDPVVLSGISGDRLTPTPAGRKGVHPHDHAPAH